MNSPVQKIKERLTIEEVVSSYIKLEGAGANLKAKCPFHNEKTASFFVSPARGSYYCFGCGASGDVFTFVEEFEGLDFKGALKLLADRAHVELVPFSKENKEEESEKEKLYRVMEDATNFFTENLARNKNVTDYLVARGLEEKTIKDFRLGYADPEWRNLYFHLSKLGWNDAIIEKAGLAKRSEKGFYDRFRGRVMFPLTDSSGRVVAFSGRLFEDKNTTPEQNANQPKYLNSPETPIFSKNAVLYGIDKAKDSIRKNNFSILVEGQMDLILSHQAGYRNTVATSGTALSDSTVSKENVVSNLGLVRRLSHNIVLGFDADKAGANATVRAGKIALSLGMEVKVVEMPEGVDPADLISKTGPAAWKEAIKNSKHLIEFLLRKALRTNPDPRKAGKEIKDKVLPFVSALESSIEKAHFLKKISEDSSIPLAALEEDLLKVEQEQKAERQEIKEAKESIQSGFRKDYILRKLLGIIFWQQSLGDTGTTALLSRLAEIIGKDANALAENMQNKKEDLIFEAEVFYGGGADLHKDIEEMFINLEEEYLKEKLALKMRDLHEAEQAKDSQRSAAILKECQSLNNRIQEIKNSHQ